MNNIGQPPVVDAAGAGPTLPPASASGSPPVGGGTSSGTSSLGTGNVQQSSVGGTMKPTSPSSSPTSAPGTLDLRRQLTDQNVFAFHLPSEWGEEELKREFGRFGTILSAKVVKRPDGSSKGYGFACFDNSASAASAVQQMNGHSVSGKRLKVSLKKTPEECLHMQVQKLMEISEGNQPYDREKDCTLFVFHLPAHWGDKELFSQFQSFGSLISSKVAKKEDGTSRGYGFVTYETPRAAALAITNMNGVEVGSNKRLKVQLKQQSNPPHPLPGCTIFVFHLPNDWSDSHLRQHFSHYGKILSATVQRDLQGNSRGFGFVSFDRQQCAMNAIAGMNGFSVGHKRLKVSLKKGEENRFLHYGAGYSAFPPRGPGPSFFGPSEFGFWDAATAAVVADFAASAHPHHPSMPHQHPHHHGIPPLQYPTPSGAPFVPPGAAAALGAGGYGGRFGGYPPAAAGYGYHHHPGAAGAAGAAPGSYSGYGPWSHQGPGM